MLVLRVLKNAFRADSVEDLGVCEIVFISIRLSSKPVGSSAVTDIRRVFLARSHSVVYIGFRHECLNALLVPSGPSSDGVLP